MYSHAVLGYTQCNLPPPEREHGELTRQANLHIGKAFRSLLRLWFSKLSRLLIPKTTKTSLVRGLSPVIESVFFALSASAAFAFPTVPPSQPAVANVGIIYDGPDWPLADGYLAAHYVKNLLGHFGLRGELVRLADYKAEQLTRYRATFYIGSDAGTRLPAEFLKDVRSSRQPFCWLGLNIDQLLADSKTRRQFGLRYLGNLGSHTAWRVEYQGTLFPRENFTLTVVEPVEGGQAEVRATAVQGDNARKPYALRRGRFWYFAEFLSGGGQEGSRYLVFCDLLHEILEIDHARQSQALVRIEDVSAEAEPGDLRMASDALSKRHIPFQIATIPLYRNPWNNVEMRLSDRPQVVEAIHYMIGRGGTPVMHGWSHQYHSSTGDDYEFWDGIRNKPIAGDSEQETVHRLDAGLAELFRNNIFPIAFETPHYAASAADYRAMQQRFKLFYERTMPTPNLVSVQYFPYPVIDEFGRYVVPENLGYLPLEKPDPKVIIENARYMRVVRDGLPSFYFHPFLDAKLLGQVVDGISALGYHFVSLREFGGEVEDAGRYAVRTQSGPVQLSPQDEFWRLRRFDAAGNLASEQTSPARANHPVEVDVDVPTGGWAALDCLKKTSRPDRLAEGKGRLQAWWRQWSTRGRPRETTAVYDEPREAWVLSLAAGSAAEVANQQSYVSTLGLCGFLTRTVGVEKFLEAPRDKTTLLVVPDGVGALLNNAQQEEILHYLASGGLVLADGHQSWLPRLGFQTSGWKLPVAEMQELLGEGTSFSWRPEELAERYIPPPGSRPFALDTGTKQPVAVAGQYGSGRYLYLSVPLDNHTQDGVSHYPFLAEYLAEAFHVRSALRGGRIEAYFDPGYRAGVNPDNLANFWKQSGIRAVYVAAWHFYDHYTFNYATLIRACHRNGISVYAWFMFPQVTQVMWLQHPEWREQAAAGGDGRPGWRFLMNFQNPACFRAAMDWAESLLNSQAWDGINIAELNFDAEYPDYLLPDRFVPMNNQVRADFSKLSGFDPAQLFAPASLFYHQRNPKALAAFLSYREDLVIEWHRRVLGELAPLARNRGMEVIVTTLDSLHSKYVRPALGVDSRRIAALMKEFDFTLQVEDSVEHWTEPPDRYERYAETYRTLVREQRRLMFDINVVERDTEGTSLPSTLAAGTELAETVKAAAVLGRVAIYAEHTVEPQDWRLLRIALARPAQAVQRGDTYQVDSPFPVFLDTPRDRAYSLDGHSGPVVASSGLFIPPGDHGVSGEHPGLRLSVSPPPIELWSLSCNLLAAQRHPTGFSIQYTSPAQAEIVLSRKPQEISVDGGRANLSVEGHGDEWVLLAPRGEHRLDITTLTHAGLAVNWSSWILSSVLTVIGAAVTLRMLWFYLQLRTRPTSHWRRLEE